MPVALKIVDLACGSRCVLQIAIQALPAGIQPEESQRCWQWICRNGNEGLERASPGMLTKPSVFSGVKLPFYNN